MGLFDKLNAKNFTAFAMKFYDDPQCADIEDFQEDFKSNLLLYIGIVFIKYTH